MLDKYVLEVNVDNETGEEHCTVLKTNGTTNMTNWIEILCAMYTHHSIIEPLVKELNKIYAGYNNTEKYAITLWKENEQLKREIMTNMSSFKENNREKLRLEKENEQLKSRIDDYDVALKRLQDLTDKKLKENEQLKQEIETLQEQLAHFDIGDDE